MFVHMQMCAMTKYNFDREAEVDTIADVRLPRTVRKPLV